jgi:protein-S-isoprenylcysteine O-methyltransferase Ste14
MAVFFKNHRRLSLVAGLPCLVALVVIMLTSCQVRQDAPSGFIGYNAEALFKYKTNYVGDNSKVVNLINNLLYANLRRGISLQTQFVPYGIKVDYDFSGINLDTGQIKSSLRDNAIVMFALIDNVDEVSFSAKGTTPTFICRFSRDEMQKIYDNDLREYSKDINTLKILLRSLSFRLHVYPEKYALIMSGAPGIRITTEYRGSAAKARYSAGSGTLFTWEASTGKMSKGLPAIELPLDTPVYWSPLDSAGQVSGGSKNLVTVTLLDKQGRRIDEKQVTILYDGSLYYTVQPAMDIVIGEGTPYLNQKAGDLDSAVGLAIKSQSNKYSAGETATEGHIILDSEENDGTFKVYAIASLGVFGFENGIFTIVSGSGAIPTVMIFSRNENGEYSLLEYKEPKEKDTTRRPPAWLNLYFLVFIIPGLDFRFHWSSVPFGVVIAANAVVFLGYIFIIIVFKENSNASTVVQVEQKQQVITTGSYAIVRHPMYLVLLLMLLLTPLAPGSYWAIIPSLLCIPTLVFRIKGEEVLLRDLPGYKEYYLKTRYRLIPPVW